MTKREAYLGGVVLRHAQTDLERWQIIADTIATLLPEGQKIQVDVPSDPDNNPFGDTLRFTLVVP